MEPQSPQKSVVVLGTYHQLQRKGHEFNERLRAAIQLVRDENKFQITEEWWTKPIESFASTFKSATLKWENVDPEEPQFETWGRGLNCHSLPMYDSSKPRIPEYGPLDVQERREAYMAARIADLMQPHSVGMFIVGLGHLHSMLIKIRTAGFNVKGFSWTGDL